MARSRARPAGRGGGTWPAGPTTPPPGRVRSVAAVSSWSDAEPSGSWRSTAAGTWTGGFERRPVSPPD